MKLPATFYNRPTLTVARELLGKHLVRNKNGVITVGEIIETEAYTQDDPASHSYRGVTERTKPMFGPPGFAYVYFVYGMYHCVNVVTEPEGKGAAVLIRSLKPVRGLDTMKRRLRVKRKKQKGRTSNELCNGPGKLCLAMGIDKKLNRANLQGGELCVLARPQSQKSLIKQAPRVGIKEGRKRLWRFTLNK